ncbi:MAG: GH3 auxin-responsive promoter family protein [Cyanobacteria bacterium]|nr:GH3 auxin-responsive promoter family protein [Cyanobacteriota bacterium]
MKLRSLLYKGFSALALQKIRQFELSTHCPREAQLEKLRSILSKNQSTRFGREHAFAGISTWQDFQKSVPIRTYDAFKPYIDRLTGGDEEVLTTQAPFMFATTSGTTGEPKYIPITNDYMEEFRFASVVSGYHLLKNCPGIAGGTALSMTSAAEEGRTPSGIPYGAMSGALFQRESFLMRKFISPIPYEAYLIKDYESRYYTILRLALSQPVSFFYTLNPSTIQLLCRRLGHYAGSLIRDIAHGTTTPPESLDRATASAISHLTRPDTTRARELERLVTEGKFTPEHIWPMLAVVSCWTKAAAAFYLSDFPKYFGSVPIRDITYGASEGRGTVFLAPDKQALALHSHFYEFVPESEIESASPTVLLADQLIEGENYYILFTNSAGLYRYNINDVVKVNGFHNATPLLEFQYKGGNISSFTGEKITELQVTDTMTKMLEGDQLDVRFFTLIPEFRPDPHYQLWIEPDGCELSSSALRELAERFDRTLGSLNIEYQVKRDSQRLGQIVPYLISAGTYESLRRHLVAHGTPDSQIKVSHLNPKDDLKSYIKQRLKSAAAAHSG